MCEHMCNGDLKRHQVSQHAYTDGVVMPPEFSYIIISSVCVCVCVYIDKMNNYAYCLYMLIPKQTHNQF